MAPMPSGKHHPVSFSIGAYGYAVTGTNTQELPSNDVYMYDQSTDQWSELVPFPGQARSFAIGQEYNGKGYLGFGASTNAYFNDIWEFEPLNGTWTQLTTCDCIGRRHPAFVIKDDKIYVGLGDGAPGDLDDWHIYDMINDTWTQVDDLPGSGRHHPFMFPAGDDMYVGMGHSGGVIYDDWYKFNTTSDTWETMNDFPDEARVAGTQFGLNGNGYVLSGDGDNHNFMPTGEFWEYDPATDSWNELDPHPGISIWAPGSFVIDGAVYLLGGENRQSETILNSVWSYQLLSPTSINEIESTVKVQVYPNPAENGVNIRSEATIENIRIVSLTGNVVMRSSAKTLDISDLTSGVYFVQGQTEAGEVFNEKLLVR